LLGIVTSTLNPFAVAATTGGLPQNVNFAVKAERSIPMLQQAGVPAPVVVPTELATAATGVVRLKSEQAVHNTYVLVLKYVSGWDFYHGFQAFSVILFDVGSEEVVMEYHHKMSQGGVLLSENGGIDEIVEQLLTRNLFKSTVNDRRNRQRRAQRKADQRFIGTLAPQLTSCVKSLPSGSRAGAHVSLYVTPAGHVRYPGLRVIGEGKELVGREAFERARDCIVPHLRTLRFARAAEPRYYLEAFYRGT
jgi:hypothetical protein